MDSAIRFDRVRLRPRELVPALVCSLGVESGVMLDEGGGAAEGALGDRLRTFQCLALT